MDSNKDWLEQLISENRDFFDPYQPSDILRQRVKKERQAEKKRSYAVISWMYGAAAVLAVVIFTVCYTGNKTVKNNPPVAKENSVSGDDGSDSMDEKKQDLAVIHDTAGYQETGLVALKKKKPKNDPVIAEENKEQDNEEIYHYARLIEIKQNQLKMLQQTEPGLYRDFVKDIKILESAYQELKMQLKENRDKEPLLEAMIENLKMQAALLNTQLGIYRKNHNKKQGREKMHQRSGSPA